MSASVPTFAKAAKVGHPPFLRTPLGGQANRDEAFLRVQCLHFQMRHSNGSE
jgi:hypothetical protein